MNKENDAQYKELDKVASSAGLTLLMQKDGKHEDSQSVLENQMSNPIIFSWRPSETQLLEKLSSQSILLEPLNRNSKTITNDPIQPSDTWLLGGSLGSRYASLVFKSSALAHSSQSLIENKPGHKLHITYKVLQAETKLLSKLLECHGIAEVAANSSDFNLLWTGSHPKPGTLRALAPHQRVNHFPRSYELTRKDRLYKNIERMQHTKGFKHFDFIPQTFIMPTEYGDLCSTHHRIKGPWIVKPVASSRGRGIFIVETPNQVPLEEPVVVAKYISRPLLVSGHKCDLRLYVSVTSYDPLLVYIYEEGLVRFATVKYDSSHKQLWNPCMHLCNYSINKYHSDYIKPEDPSAENVGHKWTLSALLRHLKSEGKNTTQLMSQIEDLIIKSILASANSIIAACRMFVPNLNNCFELFGFDILIDADLKPWLLEVNLSPSLGCDTPLDVRLKSAMLADLLTLVGIPAVDPILRPSTNSLTSTTSSKSSNGRVQLCRRVHSADGLSSSSNTLPKKHSSKTKTSKQATAALSAEESRIVRMAKGQFERRGGFVRIFPSIDSWTKYAQYLDPATGIPISGNNSAITNFNLSTPHNYNLLLYTQLFSDVPPIQTKLLDRSVINNKYNSLDRKRVASIDSNNSNSLNSRQSNSGMNNSGTQARQTRYERMLSQGHKSALTTKRAAKDQSQQSMELKRQILDMLKGGRKLTQCETRRTFSHYLGCVLKRVSTNSPDQEEQMEIVLKFLDKASNYLRTPYSVKTPSQSLELKDRAAVVAKQLHDFLYLYNRETDIFLDKSIEKPSQVPAKLYTEFLEIAKESDLEDILVYQTTQTSASSPVVGGINKVGGFQGVLKCIPNVPKSLKPAYKNATKTNKPLKVSSLS